MISPHDLGFPSKFSGWRLGQEKIVTDMLYDTKRYGVYVVPMGGGKSACYMAAAILSGDRTLILTSTKGLQDQLEKDFPDLVTVVKGQSSYHCRLSKDIYWCNTGSCHWGYNCPYKNDGCRYRDNIRVGEQARIVATNYSFWMANNSEILGNFDLLIADEAHNAADHLLSALSSEIKQDEVSGLIEWVSGGLSQGEYTEWARILKGRVDDKVKKVGPREMRGKFRLLALQQKLLLLDKMWVSNWVVEHKGKSIAWDAIWPAVLTQSYLFRGIPRVILTSATVTRMDMTMMGVKSEEYDYKEYPSTFPIANRRIFFIPTIRMDRFITGAGMNAWAARIDNIIGTRLGYKGIIHTASYDRAKRICGFSTYKDFMLSHDYRTTQQVINQFKMAEPPAILVSPSVSTGYDFPDDQARWSIVGKVPFPDSRPLVMKERQKVNPDYGCHQAIKQLIQESGRLVRSPTDWGECFIIDSHFQWIVSKYKGEFPKWWMEALTTTNAIPEAR